METIENFMWKWRRCIGLVSFVLFTIGCLILDHYLVVGIRLIVVSLISDIYYLSTKVSKLEDKTPFSVESMYDEMFGKK